MPNFVLCNTYFEGETKDLDRLEDFVRDGDNPFSFDKIIPTPESMFPEIIDGIGYVSGNTEQQILCYITDKGKIHYRDAEGFGEHVDSYFRSDLMQPLYERILESSEEEKEEMTRVGKIKLENFKKYKVYDWLDFHTFYWGTKWDAHNVTLERLTPNKLQIVFDTAWSFPGGIFAELNKRFPDLTITAAFADENWLSGNCGFVQSKGTDFYHLEKDIGDNDSFYVAYAKYLWTGDGAFTDYEDAGDMGEEEFFKLLPKRVKAYI